MSRTGKFTSTISQFVLDNVVSSKGLVRQAWAKLRSLLILLWDGPIECEYCEVRLSMPLSHELPIYQERFPQYGTNLGRIAAAALRKYPDLVAVDVGANVGDSAVVLRSAGEFPILCVEGEPRFFSYLEHNLRTCEDIHLTKVFLSDVSTEAMGRVTIGSGSAQLHIGETGGTRIETQTLTHLLSNQPGFELPKFVKIDTDGFDCRIVIESQNLIARAKPILFFEYLPGTPYGKDCDLAVFETLRQSGFVSALFYDNTGDYLLTLDLGRDLEILEDLSEFFSGREDKKYCDVCAFHSTDADLAQELRRGELAFFRHLRGG